MMNHYFRCLFQYFEQVLHPAGGWAALPEKRKRKELKSNPWPHHSPDALNLRSNGKKSTALRRNPAP